MYLEAINADWFSIMHSMHQKKSLMTLQDFSRHPAGDEQIAILGGLDWRYIGISLSSKFPSVSSLSPSFPHVFFGLTPRKASRMDCNASVVSPRQTPKLKTPHGPLAPSRRSRPKSCETHHWNDHHRVALQWYQQSHVSNPQFFGRDLISFHQKVCQILKSWMGFNEEL